ncbi:MAG: TetR/AcrR family transcriptional regulator [Stellaceae bacterium]
MPKVSEAHREARRQQVLDAAIACFARDGFHQTSMADILRQSGLSAGAVYSYFSGKDEIIAAVAEDRHRQEAELNAAAAAQSDPVEALHELARAYAGWMFDPAAELRRRVGVQGWAEALHSPEIRALVLRGMSAAKETLGALIRRAQAEGRIAPAFDAEALARAMVALFQGFALQLAWDEEVDCDAHLATVERLLAAITSDPSRGAKAGHAG